MVYKYLQREFPCRPLIEKSQGRGRQQKVLYIKALAAPFTVKTMLKKPLKALGQHAGLGKIMAADGEDCEDVLGGFENGGMSVDALAAQLQTRARSRSDLGTQPSNELETHR